jgi:hypothetical protein
MVNRKHPLTSSDIESATFWFVEYLHHDDDSSSSSKGSIPNISIFRNVNMNFQSQMDI